MCYVTEEDMKIEPIHIVILKITLLIVVLLGGGVYLSRNGKSSIDYNNVIRQSIKNEIISWAQSQPDSVSASSIAMNYYQCQDNSRLRHSDCIAMIGDKDFKSVIINTIINSEVPRKYKDRFLGTTTK